MTKALNQWLYAGKHAIHIANEVLASICAELGQVGL